MSELKFHKCRLCGDLFYAYLKDTYCRKCIPTYKNKNYSLNIKHLSEIDMEEKRAKERARWHARMANPVFREHERLRSLARARAEKKYAKEVK